MGLWGSNCFFLLASQLVVNINDDDYCRLMNLNLADLQCFQCQDLERREELIINLLEELDLIIFHLEEQEVVR